MERVTTFIINYSLPNEREAVSVYEAESLYDTANGNKERGAVLASRLLAYIREHNGEYKLRKYITATTK